MGETVSRGKIVARSRQSRSKPKRRKSKRSRQYYSSSYGGFVSRGAPEHSSGAKATPATKEDNAG